MRGRDSEMYRRMSQPWQLRALSYYDAIGEIRFACQFYAKLISKVRYFPALQNEDDTKTPIESGLPVEILHRIQDPGGGRSRLQYDYGRMMGVTGEGVLFGDRLDTDEERWRFLWKDEVRRVDDGGPYDGLWERVRYDKQAYNPPEIGIAYRFWTPHPLHSDLADSPLRSVLDIAEELLILTASVRSTAITRMTNGVFVVPTELSPDSFGPPTDDEYLGDEDPMNNPFLADWIEHTENQIEEPGAAEAKVPFILEGSHEYIDRIRWIQTHDPQTDYMERELRKEAVHRLALGMDFPPEFLLGMSEANHWTARQVVYDMWRSYGTPVAERFADDLADVFLRPALRDMGYDGWQNVVVDFDDSRVVIPPDMTEIAKQALDMIAIGRPAYRKLIGVTEDMAPDEEEEEFLASIKLRQPVEFENGALVMPERGPVANGNGRDAEDGPPAPSGGREVSRQESRTASAELQGAARLALLRCRELAGIRIRHKCPDCGGDHPDTMVAAAVGAEGVVDPMKLVKGATDGFQLFLVDNGLDPAQAQSLGQQLEVYAARTLFDQRCPDLPSGFVASLERAQEVSDAVR